MRQLQDRERVVYIDQDGQEITSAPTVREVVRYVTRERRPAVERWGVSFAQLMAVAFTLGFLALCVAMFVVDSPEWILRRLSAVLLVIFLFGMVGAVVFGLFMGIMQAFVPPRRYYDE